MYPDLKLGGYEHGRGADELQHVLVDQRLCKVVVYHLHSKVQRLVVQLEVFLEMWVNFT